MSDPYLTWLRERWPKLMSVEALIAETAWHACERLHHAEIERLTAELTEAHDDAVVCSADAADTREQLNVAAEENVRLRAECHTLAVELGQRRDDKKQLLEEVATQHAAVESADAEIERLTEELREKTKENTKQRAEIVELNLRIKLAEGER